jgi:hypothetical protein
MLVTFWVIVAMVGFLWFPNTRYAIRQYWANRNRALFTFYMILLVILGYLLVTLTTHLIAFSQASQEILQNF